MPDSNLQIIEQSEDHEEAGPSKYKITRVQPQVVDEVWPFIKQALALFSPEDVVLNEETLVNYLQAFLAGRMEIWSVHMEGVLKGMVFTTVTEDTLAQQKCLLVYGVASFEPSPLFVWSAMLRELKKYAKLKECNFIVANSHVKSVIEFVRRLGGNVERRYLVLEV